MSRRDDLIALRDAVQAGEWFPGLAQRSIGGVQSYHNARKAFEGSVDAALAFLAAALPGWHFDVATSADGLSNYASVSSPAEHRKVHMADSRTPARALLLATLKALIAEADT